MRTPRPLLQVSGRRRELLGPERGTQVGPGSPPAPPGCAGAWAGAARLQLLLRLLRALPRFWALLLPTQSGCGREWQWARGLLPPGGWAGWGKLLSCWAAAPGESSSAQAGWDGQKQLCWLWPHFLLHGRVLLSLPQRCWWLAAAKAGPELLLRLKAGDPWLLGLAPLLRVASFALCGVKKEFCPIARLVQT